MLDSHALTVLRLECCCCTPDKTAGGQGAVKWQPDVLASYLLKSEMQTFPVSQSHLDIKMVKLMVFWQPLYR